METLGALADIAVEKALLKCCGFVEDKAKEKCPVGTGELRRQISYEIHGNVGTIGTNVEYAPYVEFGTGSHSSLGNGRRGYWVYVPHSDIHTHRERDKIYTYEQAKWIADRLREKGLNPVITNGQNPHPFLQPALLDHRQEIIDLFNKEIEKSL